MKIISAVVADVEKALEEFKAACKDNPYLEASSGKKLAAAVDVLTPKDNVTKNMNQAYTNAEKKWAMNVLNGQADGCEATNKLMKIKEYVQGSTSYNRLAKDPTTVGKVSKWVIDKFDANMGVGC